MLKKAKNIFVVGVGGIGVSGLARILKLQGRTVSGSDIVRTDLTEALNREGVPVTIGHRRENLPDGCDLLIYSAAIPDDNAERNQAREQGIAEMSYPKALGELLVGYKVIAVAGTNGKTTTAAMIANVLESAGKDPTVLVGSQILVWQSNARFGKSEYFVVEADEYRRAFLNYPADVAVITNIEPDHLDYFSDLGDVKKAFQEFVSLIKPTGVLVYNLENANLVEIANEARAKMIGFRGIDLKDARLLVPGGFNRENAAGAAAACRVLRIPEGDIISSLERFTGTWRRFEKVGKLWGADIISDYAHHPAGIAVTLKAAGEVYQGKKILAVFQPHQHNRTKKLFNEFVQSFCQSQLQDFIISEIFDVAGREELADRDISSRDLVTELEKCGKNAYYAKDLEGCEQQVRKVIKGYNAVIFMGAGDIYKVANNLVK